MLLLAVMLAGCTAAGVEPSVENTAAPFATTETAITLPSIITATPEAVTHDAARGMMYFVEAPT